MNRSVLETILARIPDLETKGSRYQAASGHLLTFYLGQPGQAMVIREVAVCTLEEGFLELETAEKGGTFFVAYDALHAVSHKPGAKEPRKTGF